MKKIISILLVIGLIFSVMQINVFATENKIVSITFEDIGVYEGTGNLTNGKYIYSYRPNFSVTLSDGTVKKSVQGMGVEIDGTYYTVKYSDTQAENPWTPGNTYTVIGTVSGVSGKLNVTVYESPITNIEFDDITFAVGDYSYSDNYGTYNGKYDISYVISNKDFRVTEKSGTVRTIHDSYSLGNRSYQPRITTDLPISKWEPGNVYQVTGTLFGISNTFNIHYEENPVQSIDVDDLCIVEHSGGSWMENKSWYYYFPEPKNITIHYKNGSSISGTRGDIGNKTGYWVNYEGIDQYSNHWELDGTYKAKATYRGVSAYYNVNITGSNVKSVEINDISIKLNSFLNENTEIYINFLILFSTGSAFITLIVIFSILLLILILTSKDFTWIKNVSSVFMLITISHLLASFILTIIFSYSTRLPIFDIRIEFLRAISNVIFNNQIKVWILLLASGLIYRILYIIFNKTIKKS